MEEITETKTVRVLIADDSACLREGLRNTLERVRGLEVIGEASDGQEALRLVEKLRPHVVLMDVRMPVMGGLEATRLIKSSWPSIKVIVMSIDEDYRMEALAAGADAFLIKTFSIEELLEAIAPLQS